MAMTKLSVSTLSDYSIYETHFCGPVLLLAGATDGQAINKLALKYLETNDIDLKFLVGRLKVKDYLA